MTKASANSVPFTSAISQVCTTKKSYSLLFPSIAHSLDFGHPERVAARLREDHPQPVLVYGVVHVVVWSPVEPGLSVRHIAVLSAQREEEEEDLELVVGQMGAVGVAQLGEFGLDLVRGLQIVPAPSQFSSISSHLTRNVEA